ncbi:MerR family transcriptional regulator [Planobispora siamensis]|uniref:MerR family transcriptional regulator n=1 Tax=Planobispora siamensis TaxID=936338 RepID=A0A8J3SDL5_9ACTN|nr:MerR family transcriptional regulator [Planobispora siamensis]GIH90595.1 MerR family transcriptional regulator [Planobispora siamensis]
MSDGSEERASAGLRPVDLARLVGLSTQQIRNYAEMGVLPPVPRTPSGYRRFDARHRRALLACRALERGYGLHVARSIMQAVHAGDLPRALTLMDAGHAALHEQRISLRAAGEALEAVAEQAPEAADVPRQGMRIGEVAAYLGVRTSALRLWESAGLLTPRREAITGYRRFDAADVRDARMIQLLRRSRYPLAVIRPILDGLRRTGSSDALRAAIAQRQAELIERAAVMLEGASLLHRHLVALGLVADISTTRPDE